MQRRVALDVAVRDVPAVADPVPDIGTAHPPTDLLAAYLAGDGDPGTGTQRAERGGPGGRPGADRQGSAAAVDGNDKSGPRGCAGRPGPVADRRAGRGVPGAGDGHQCGDRAGGDERTEAAPEGERHEGPFLTGARPVGHASCP